jgi:uncharacterized protein (DUF433 family)
MGADRLEALVGRLQATDGKVHIAGTTIEVRDVLVWHVVEADSEDSTARQHPPISQDDVHAALLFCWVNRDEMSRQVQDTAEPQTRRWLKPSQRATTWIGTAAVLSWSTFIVTVMWAKFQFLRQANAGNNNFLAWAIDNFAVWLLPALLLMILSVHHFLNWYLQWTMRLNAAEIAAPTKHGFRGPFTLGFALAACFVALDFVNLWLMGQPFGISRHGRQEESPCCSDWFSGQRPAVLSPESGGADNYSCYRQVDPLQRSKSRCATKEPLQPKRLDDEQSIRIHNTPKWTVAFDSFRFL